MNSDDFEKRLQRQPLRQIPAGWRAEILSAATEQSPRADVRASWSPLNWPDVLWRELVWPSRRAWAGIAAAWVVIVIVNVHDVSHTGMARHDFTPPSPAVMMALWEQERWLTDFTGPDEARDADRPKKSVPAPRSEWHDEFFQA